MSHEHAPRPTLRRLLLELSCAAAVTVAITAGLGGPGIAQAASGLAAAAAGAPVVRDTDDVVPGLAADTLLWQDSLIDPLVVRSMNGVLTATLEVTYQTMTVPRGGGTSVQLPLRNYTLVSTTDTAYTENDPRFTPRFPGPTFRVRPGDLVQITLRNSLTSPTVSTDSNTNCMNYTAADSGANPQDVYQDCFHGPNYTNIHYHGMHVTPDSTVLVVGDSAIVGDDVLMTIAPGTSIRYNFRIPLNQSPGTHWYHPHKHGSVAIQVVNGMAGAFIVEDPTMGLDSLQNAYNIREHLIAFQQIDTTVALIGSSSANTVTPLVNGQAAPVIYMAPGEVQRWRIVNENVTRNTKTLEFSFQDLPGEEPGVWDIARDGVAFAPGNYGQQSDSILQMGAGNRLDVFVQAPASEGTYSFRVRHLPGASRRARLPVLPLQTTEQANAEATNANAFTLFQVVVDSSRANPSLGRPATLPALPAFLQGKLAGSSDTAVIVFTDTLAQAPTQFYLGSATQPYQRFDDTVVFTPSDSAGTPRPMYLDSTQTWLIVNRSQQQINHPFHIHINPFQVDSVHAPMGEQDAYWDLYQQLNTASRDGSPIWLDVLPLPQPTLDTVNGTAYVKDPGYVFITQKYDDFEGCSDGRCGPPVGEFVMHCHILGHEERGMMQVLQVRRHGDPAPQPRGHGSGSHGAHTAAPGSGQGGGPGSGQGGGQGQRRQNTPGGHRH